MDEIDVGEKVTLKFVPGAVMKCVADTRNTSRTLAHVNLIISNVCTRIVAVWLTRLYSVL